MPLGDQLCRAFIQIWLCIKPVFARNFLSSLAKENTSSFDRADITIDNVLFPVPSDKGNRYSGYDNFAWQYYHWPNANVIEDKTDASTTKQGLDDILARRTKVGARLEPEEYHSHVCRPKAIW